ncbi:hypothetical protein Ddc_17950 [Ditylenchus destructor]|nr:hypothetical protein Ddc_17950 [Ditylenchus destructor]
MSKNSVFLEFFAVICSESKETDPGIGFPTIFWSEVNRNSTGITIFDKVLYLKAYSEWVIYNNYSIEVPLQDQDGSTQSTLYKRKIYGLWANAVYKDSNGSYGIKKVLSASVKLNQGNWPVFQHFVRLLTDPFIYIRRLELIPQIEVSNLLACGANNLDHNRVKCTVLSATLRGNVQTLIKWIKGHARCDSFCIEIYTNSNYDEELLDVFMNGAKCTSEITLGNYDLCKVLIIFVQKFMDLKSCNENLPVETTRGIISNLHVEEVKRCYAEFIVKEERNEDDESIEQVFEFVNSDIGKKLELKIRIILHYWKSEFSTKIANL